MFYGCVMCNVSCRCCFLRAASHRIADPSDPYKLTEETRELGLVVCRGTQVSLISPRDGMEEIENPFAAPEG